MSSVARVCCAAFFLCDNSFQSRDVFQQALAGQDQEVIAELRILKVDLEQLFVGDPEACSNFGFTSAHTAVIAPPASTRSSAACAPCASAIAAPINTTESLFISPPSLAR